MRVQHLIVAGFPPNDSGNEEVALGCGALYEKPRNPEPSTKTILYFHTRKSVPNKDQALTKKMYGGTQVQEDVGVKAVLAKGVPLTAITDWTDVGLYLVFHCTREARPILFEGAASTFRSGWMTQEHVAVAVVSALGRAGIAGCRKVALVACNAATPANGNEVNFLEAFCGALKTSTYVFNPMPMIAGWDVPIFVDDKTGRKVTSAGGGNVDENFRKEHKLIATFRGGQYKIDRLENSGWSDKVQLPTQLGPTCSLF